MNENQPKYPRIDTDIPNGGAVSLYEQNNSPDEEFPVLKAFQQYIDSENAKARKRLISLGIFFGVLMGAVIAVFVSLLLNFSQRNQLLNDRLVEFAMKERERAAATPVIGRSAVPQTQAANDMIVALTAQIKELQNTLQDSQKQTNDTEAARTDAAKPQPKVITPEQKEIQRLNALLAAERQKNAEKAAEEQKIKREIELEAYRRKHYPELYAPKPAVPEVKESQPAMRKPTEKEIQEIFDEIDGKPEKRTEEPRQNVAENKDVENKDVKNKGVTDKEVVNKDVEKKNIEKKNVSEASAISYFTDDDLADAPKADLKPAESAPSTPTPPQSKLRETPADKSAQKPADAYAIPVDVKGSTSQWQIPE